MKVVGERLKIVDSDGFIVGYIGDGDKIIKKSSIDAARNNNVWQPEERFAKAYPTALRKLSKMGCTANEFMVLFLAVSKLSFKSGLLMHSNGSPVTAEWMSGELNMHLTKVYEAIRKLAAKNIIYRGLNNKTKTTEYYLNPYYFFKGEKINATLVSMFADPKDRV